MKTDQIKTTIEAIINYGSGMIYTDAGSGSGGPGYADGDTLREMLDRGDFDDAVIVEMDDALARASFSGQCEYDEATEWTQIEYGYGDNNYRQIGWIWDV